MIIDYTKVEHIYIVCGKTDMRRDIDGLAALSCINMNLMSIQMSSFYFVVDDLTDSKHCIEREMVFFSSIKDLKMENYAGLESILKLKS